MATANSVWYTSTEDVYQEAPFKSINAPQIIPFSETVAATDLDSAGDIFNLVRLPQTAKLLFIYFEISDIDTGTDSDIDFESVETNDGTTTTTELYAPGTLGQAAATGYILPAVDTAFLRAMTPTDSGEVDIRLYQNATRSATAGTVKGFVVYL